MQLLLLPVIEELLTLWNGIPVTVGRAEYTVKAMLLFCSGDYRAIPKLSCQRQAPAKFGACYVCDVKGVRVERSTVYSGHGSPLSERAVYHCISENRLQKKQCPWKSVNVFKLFLPYWRNTESFYYCWAHGVSNIVTDLFKRLQNSGSKKMKPDEYKRERVRLGLPEGTTIPPWVLDSKLAKEEELRVHATLVSSKHRKRGIGKKSPFFKHTKYNRNTVTFFAIFTNNILSNFYQFVIITNISNNCYTERRNDQMFQENSRTGEWSIGCT